MKVIYMMADTFRRDHVGAYGNAWIRTPNLDRLAARSAVFDNAYIGSFPTVPNRRDTLLGRGDLGLPFNRWKGFERSEVTLPERLAALVKGGAVLEVRVIADPTVRTGRIQEIIRGCHAGGADRFRLSAQKPESPR